MFDTIAGLPVHALVVHAVVVLVPLGCLGMLLYVMVPSWRRSLRWPVLAVATAGAAAAPIAYLSGGTLQKRLGLVSNEQVVRHGEFGLRALIAILVWWVLVAYVLGRKTPVYEKVPVTGTPLLVVVVLVSLATVAGVVVTGHSGANAVWGAIVENTDPP